MLNNVFYRKKMHFIDLFYLCLVPLLKNSNSYLYNFDPNQFVSIYGNLQLPRFKNSGRKEQLIQEVVIPITGFDFSIFYFS